MLFPEKGSSEVEDQTQTQKPKPETQHNIQKNDFLTTNNKYIYIELWFE